MCEFQDKVKENKHQITNTSKNEKSLVKKESPMKEQVSKPTNLKNVTPPILTFEDALALTKFGKFNYFLIFICGAILTTVLLETLGISFVLPVSDCDMELTTQDKGVLSAVGFAGTTKCYTASIAVIVFIHGFIEFDTKLLGIRRAEISQWIFLECTTQLDISTYGHSLVLELLYAIGFGCIGLIINAVGKLPILFFILAGCGVSGLATVYIDLPILGIYLYLILLLCGLGVIVVNAATVDLFPTNLRAMAVCISLMMGRLGSVVGANIFGLLLDNHCELAFILSGSSLMFAGVLAFFIPNIRDKETKPEISHASMPHRASISSIGR